MRNKVYYLLICFSAFIGGCKHADRGSIPLNTGGTSILLFNGTGASPNEIIAIEDVLYSNHFSYSTANSSELNNITEAQLHKYKLLIIPGGNFIDIGKSLSPNTSLKIHNAVHSGLNYLGICAGAFLAGNSSYYNGINLTSGITFPFYSAEEKGLHKAPVLISAKDSPALDQYWEDGPQLTGWGMVVAKYPEGTAAVAEGSFGNGFIILSGIHPEAPESWRKGMNFTTGANTDNAYAASLIRAALNRTLLAHY